MLEVLRQDYIRTARAKGLSELKVVVKHAMANVMIPVMTVIGIIMSVLISGSVVVETVFSVPGIGSLLISAIQSSDTPVVMAITFVYAVLVVAFNMVADLVYVPLQTELLAAAQARGLKTADGLGMLLHQAVRGFELWFGRRPQVTAELRALVEADLKHA
jgi:ABC-type microcin C transport system permease subunit YejE